MSNGLTAFNIEKNVDSLESYLGHLAACMASVNSFGLLQEKAERIGIFDPDETAKSQAVKGSINDLLRDAEDIFRMCADRTGEEWEDLYQRIMKKVAFATNSVDSGRKSVAKPKKGKKK